VDFTDTIRIQERHLILLLLDYLAVVYYEYTYIVGTYKIHMHWLRNRTEQRVILPVSKVGSTKSYIFRQCTSILFIYSVMIIDQYIVFLLPDSCITNGKKR
jgi:hypothetical protein